ncbi:hypothetical protein Scep_000925 [Stephania cephalantha]|uniref:Protein kinase domain-containing protein n=1 Tax=Stephania cephalantha TaxID=152367 RepID=A0AAP0LB38_9MAGN
MDQSAQAVIAAAASFFVVTILVGLIVLICKGYKTPRSHHHQSRSRNRNRNRTAPNPTLTNLNSITISDVSASFDPSLDRISMPDLITATRNFSSDGVIGDGSFGLVYKARLSNGVTVAVKKLSKDAFQGLREFRAEMETLGKEKIRHPNLVKILGYCVSGDDRILIYEFVEKGCLDQWIHDTCFSGSSASCRAPLSWDTRVRIVKGVARGLAFLHNLETPIIHRDIKGSNVLLDKDFEAHIADFGLARRVEASHSHVSTQVAGTMGYMPPEYKDGVTAATVSADVYSFGILMIEVATGRRPNWPIKTEDGNLVGLAEWARRVVEEGRHAVEIIDMSVAREGLREEEVREFLRVAFCCIKEKARERPLMVEVVEILNQLSSS